MNDDSSPMPRAPLLSSYIARFCESRWCWLFTFALFFLIRALYAVKIGVILSPDSGAYNMWANKLIALHFNYAAFLRDSSSSFPPVLYSGFITLVALLKLIFGTQWATALVVVNALAQSALGVLIIWLVRRVGNDRRAMIVAAAIYLVAFEITFWTPYALSDSVAIFLFFSAFALLAISVLNVEKSRSSCKELCAASALLLVSLFFRPTGILLLPLLPLTWWMNRSRVVLRATTILAGAGASAAMIIVAHSWLMQNPSRWPLRALSGVVSLNAAHYRLGEVMWDRPETFHAPPQTLTDFVCIALDRAVHFFYFLHRDFSLSHNALNIVFFVPLYLLAARALWRLVRRGETWSRAQRKVVWLALSAIYITTLFHALVQVDYDWRYRLPILPPLILLAALSCCTRPPSPK